MFYKFLLFLGFLSAILSCTTRKEKNEIDIDLKEKVMGHWYCAPDSDYQEIIFNDSAFIANGAPYGTMFRYVKYLQPDSIHILNESGVESKAKAFFEDSVMILAFEGGQTTYWLISRLANREHDFELLFNGSQSMQGIFYWEARNRMISWISGEKFSQWRVRDKPLKLDAKIDLLKKVDDSFVEAMLAADDNYKNSTLPLFHFFDADGDGVEEIGFWGTAGAADEFFKAYKLDSTRYKPWLYEFGRLLHCSTFRDTTWIEIYRPTMVGDEMARDSVVTFTIAKELMKRDAR